MSLPVFNSHLRAITHRDVDSVAVVVKFHTWESNKTSEASLERKHTGIFSYSRSRLVFFLSYSIYTAILKS